MTDSPLFYFAYGSNLNFKVLADWCRRNGDLRHPQEWLRPVWPAYLPDYALAFSRNSLSQRGEVLNIVPAIGCRVPGMIFEVSGNGWEILDRKEGAPSFFRRVEGDAIGENNETYRVAAYKAASVEIEYAEPNEEFLSAIRQGLNDFDIETGPFEQAVKSETRPGRIDNLFVYGTLMRGESRHSVLSGRNPTQILPAETWGRLFDCGSYPGMILDLKTIPMVHGEFYQFPAIEAVLPKLDEIEGFDPKDREGSLFNRIRINVGLGEGRVRPAWTYAINRKMPEGSVIISGDWREYRGNK